MPTKGKKRTKSGKTIKRIYPYGLMTDLGLKVLVGSNISQCGCNGLSVRPLAQREGTKKAPPQNLFPVAGLACCECRLGTTVI